MAKPWTLPTVESHGRLPSEDEEQIEFIRWFRRTFPGVLIHSIPNEAKRSLRDRALMKAKGLVSGMPDFHVPLWNWWGELKTQDGGDKGSKTQKDIHEKLRAAGDRVDICWGSSAAKEVALEVAALHRHHPRR